MATSSIVIGAGIVGLVAAYFEAKKGHRVLVIDSAAEPGGLLKSSKSEYGDFDFGTHVGSATGLLELDDFLFSGFNEENCSVFTCGESGNFFQGQLSENSPFVNTRFLDQELYLKSCYELINRSKIDECLTLAQTITNRFGDTLFQHVFEPFVQQTFGCSAEVLPASYFYFFDMYRVLAFDAESTIELKKVNYLNEKLGFHKSTHGVNKYYPKQGGMGAWVSSLKGKLLDMGVEFLLDSQISAIEMEHNDHFRLHIDNKELNSSAHQLIWTISSALLPRFLPTENKVAKPSFRGTGLYDFVFDKPLKTKNYYINNFDTAYLSTRLTCYQNLVEQDGKYKVTVEVLNDKDCDWPALTPTILEELYGMGLVKEGANCLYQQYRSVAEGFPVFSSETVKQLNLLNDELLTRYSNLKLLGRSSGKGFFMSELLIDAYRQLS